ncbi:MAG: serine--tRNA ligase [Candidatus Micrarchaeota archaeon]
MLDIHLFRTNPDVVLNGLKNRQIEHPEKVVSQIQEKDQIWKEMKDEEEQLRAERNVLSLKINDIKKKGGNISESIKRSGEVATRIKVLEEERKSIEQEIHLLLLQIPNIPDQTVPVGKNETNNPEVRKWGTPTKTSKDVLSHDELGEKTGWIDFDRGAKLGGHRFTIMKGPMAKLERALINFMLSVQTKKGYLEVMPPHLVLSNIMQGTGQLPKFAEELYKTNDDLWLIPTAEVPLTNIYANEILNSNQFPINMCAYTPCYRREAGAYGKDIKGLIRQHQFNKVELVKITHPQMSFADLEHLVKDAEEILKQLELPYRVIELCTGDIGFSAAKTYDIEVWVPSQDKYREISSCSNCTDFQARRANIKFREDGKNRFAHTLNGSGLAVGRCLIAVVENYQENGVIKIPKVLQPFMECDEIKIKEG